MNYKALAYDLRKDTLDIIMAGGGGHIGGDMSEMEILVALYLAGEMNVSPDKVDDPDRDRFVLSKGHCVEAYYAVLAKAGFLDLDEVKQKFSKFGSEYIGHPNNHLPGIEMNSGSLGHGLPVSVGMAIAGKMDKRDYRVYTLVGDGEFAEGSNWEALESGAMYKLDNLCVIIDRNHLQITGNTEDVMAHENLHAKVAAFNWNVIDVEDANDLDQVIAALEEAKACKGKPTFVIANTVKGCGSPVMENKASWHHHVPSDEEYDQISKDLEARKEALENA